MALHFHYFQQNIVIYHYSQTRLDVYLLYGVKHLWKVEKMEDLPTLNE